MTPAAPDDHTRLKPSGAKFLNNPGVNGFFGLTFAGEHHIRSLGVLMNCAAPVDGASSVTD